MLTLAEIKLALKKMKNNKAPGISGVTTYILKNIPEEGHTLLTLFVQQFWEGNCNFNQWHKTKLSMLYYKGKGNTHDPNNWRGIYLKESTAKIKITILARRLL